MKTLPLLAALTLTLMLGACNSNTKSSSTSPTPGVATATVAAAPTSTPAPVPVPSRPATLADYGATIAAYLSAARGAAANCMSDLYAAWQMPVTRGCRNANTDGDTDSGIVATIARKPATGDTQFMVLILDASDSGYRLAYQSPAITLAPDAALAGGGPVLDVVDLNGGGGADVVYRSDACVAAACTTTVHVISGASDGAYVELSPVGGITMDATDTIALDDAGRITLTGGGTETPVTGPQRGRSDTWGWDGAAFTVVDRKPAPPQYLYHAILDADALLALGDYAGAQKALTAAVEDKRLKIWRPDSRERPELESYALFHAAIAVLFADGDPAVARQYLDQSKAYTTTLHAQLAGSFEAAYDAKGSISIGCGAALDDIQANRAEYEKFWDFGTANPRFNPATVCPY